MRRACIDIGSNTTRLLVADLDGDRLTEVHQERVFTAVGQSLDQRGVLPSAKLAHVVSVVAAQVESARRLGATDVRCVATAGVRRALNGADLVALIAGACDGLVVEVLSAEDEARLAFIGAAWWLRCSGYRDGAEELDGSAEPGLLGVVDVGGGSSELVVGEPPDRVAWWQSLTIGSADLVGLGLADARARVRDAFVALQAPQVSVSVVVAVGGTVASLMRLVGARRLDTDAFARALQLLERTSGPMLAQRFQLDPMRVPVLPGGLVILERIMELFGVPLLAGGAGLREGILLRR